MGWQKLLKLPVGQEVGFDTNELKDVEPIVEISETIRPRLVISIDLPGKMNILTSVCYHKEKKAYQIRVRLCDREGKKKILKPSKWRVFDEKDAQQQIKRVIKKFSKLAPEDKTKMRKVEFRPEANNEEIIGAFVSSGIFDVLSIDSKAGKVKKLA